MLYREIIAVFSEIHAKHINAPKAERIILNFKAGGKGKAVPFGWRRGFRGVKAPRFRDNGTGWW